ncbi:hypothetical protein D187_003519 [Cystobacter fuscus DSM 2262]|uniref:Zinc finger/thioredoxin putative domain-containing protein n=1 Tax=Cystobacter fuscus (strain ATCC 25194 / DSM 2262 / NBRC 100088 / M29) TaxID=1242864 RepID=S9QBV4_CYSF2|nr:zinc-ribbon domain-containing protein [Cystobacter fuscus]EPX58804.1 hypothetical protein D187_003519 [Cystobacter fuscus DSM 2262]
MIVKCEQCETRFKIPDEKVTEKGVKVRCTKCQHTFRVVREEVSPAVPAPAVVAPVPVAKPAMAARVGTPLEVPRAPAPAAPSTRPVPPGVKPAQAAAPPGLAAARGGAPGLPRVTSMEPPRTPATLDLDPLMEFAGETSSASARPLADRPLTPALSLSFDEKNPFATVDAPAPKQAVGRPSAPGRAAPAPKPAPGLAPPVPAQVPARSPTPVAMRAAPAPKPAPAPAPPAPVQVPARSPAPAPVRAAPVPLPVEEPDPFSLPPDDEPDVTTFDPDAAPAADPFALSSDSAPAAPVYEEMEGLEGNNPFVSFVPPPAAAPPPPAPVPVPVRNAAPVAAQAPAPASMGGFESDNPFAAFDPVSALPPAAAAAPAPSMPSGIPDWGAPGQQGAPSGIPDWGAPSQQGTPSGIPDWGAPAQQGAPSGIPDWGAPAGQGNAPGGPSPFQDFRGQDAAPSGRGALAEPPTPKPAPPVVAPPEAPAAAAARPAPRLVQRLAAAAVQFVVVVVLLAGLLAVALASLNEGRVELSDLSVSRIREWLSPTTPLVAKDVSNGLYEATGGKPLFFVRGEVVNRGATPIRVKARVSLFDGERRVLSSEGLAGPPPTPEDLYSVRTAGDAAALRTRLDSAAEAVAPGAHMPFVVFFFEYPENLADLRLEVTLEPQGVAATTGGVREGSAGNGQP